MIRSLSKYIKSYLIFYVFFLDKLVECDIINIKLFNIIFNNENKLLNNKVCIKIYRRRKMTKIYTTNIKKGGVGKTTITFNGAFYLAVKKNKRVLLIDLDDSCNLTKRFIDYYEEPIPEISTVKALFSDVVPVPLRLTDHLSIIAGYDHLNELTKEVEAGKGRGYLLSWYYSQLDFIEANYDYILIDTHNDFSIFTNNAIAVSDVVLAIADIDEDAIEKLKLEERQITQLTKDFINPMTNQSFVNTRLIKVGNKVVKNTSDSQAFKRAFEAMMKRDNQFLGYFEGRSLFGKTKTTRQPLTSLEETHQTPSYRQFFKNTWELFDKIFTLPIE